MSLQGGEDQLPQVDNIRDYYDEKAEGYDERIGADLASRMLGRLTWSWLEENLKGSKPLRILDAGGGTGRWAIPLAEQGHSVIILDISEKMLRIAENKARQLQLAHLIKTKVGNMEETQFPDEYFDFILCEGDAFGLTTNPAKAIHEFSRVLKPLGKLSLTIANYYKMLFYQQEVIQSKGLSEYLQRAEKIAEPFKGPHVRTYKPEIACHMLESAGFHIERTAPRFVIFDTLKSAIREKHFDEIYRLEREFLSNPHLAVLGYHVMILAEKTLPIDR